MGADAMSEAAVAMWRLRRPEVMPEDLDEAVRAYLDDAEAWSMCSTGERAYARLLFSAARPAVPVELARDLAAIDAGRRVEVLAVLAQA